MHVDEFDDILMKFASTFDCIKLLRKNLRNILFLFIEIERLNFEISVDSKTFYESIIKAFENAITSLNTNIQKRKKQVVNIEIITLLNLMKKNA